MNYNDLGNPDGEYLEFCYNKIDSTSIPKIKGAYGTKDIQFTYRNKGKEYNLSSPEVRRIGTWKSYSKEGKLLEVVEHKWV